MTSAEKELLSMYLVNQGLQLDTEVLRAKRYWDTRKDLRACTALLDALYRKNAFDKFSHDLCALLHI